MKGSKKHTSLLDALNQSVLLSDPAVAPPPLGAPSSQQKTIHDYFEGASSSSQKSNVEEQLRIARRIHDAEQLKAAGGYQISIYTGVQHQEFKY